MSPNCNTWWIEAWADDRATTSIRVELQDGGSFALNRTSWGSFAANRYLASGTSMRLRAQRTDGTVAVTNYFPFLQGQPTLPKGKTCDWDPGMSMGPNSNTWWIEVWAEDADTASVRVRRQDGSHIQLHRTAWGSFAANQWLARNSQIRLVATSNNGDTAVTKTFRFLRQQPTLDTSLSSCEGGGTGGTGGSGGSGNAGGTGGSGGSGAGNDSGTGGTGGSDVEVPVADTFYIDGTKVYDPCGNQVILRGVNKMNIWTDPDGLPSFPEIAKTGANTVRIVWTTGGSASGLDTVISNALAYDLLPMVEVHDATGDWSRLQRMVDYWVRADVLAVLKKHERTLLVNVGNEVGDWNVSESQFVQGYTTAIQRMRAAGIKAPIVIDSRGWGQDIALLPSVGPKLLNQDPLRNLIFSAHLYRANQPTSWYDNEYRKIIDADLAFVVGEFANVSVDCGSNINWRGLIEAADRYDIGWYAWSWGPGNTPCGSMDMSSNGMFNGLRGWGLEISMHHPNGINATAEPIPALTGTCN